MPDMQASELTPYAPKANQGTFTIPLDLVGGNKFGRYKKVSVEQTFNMMVSDDALVDYAGYSFILELTNNPDAEGRGIFSSIKNNIMIAVVSDGVFSINHNLIPSPIGSLDTSVGEVYISENNAGQIALSDGVNIYIYTPISGAFETATISFIPGFLSFQDTRFICASVGTSQWQLSASNNGLSWPNDTQTVGLLETKPDSVQAVVPMPGKGTTALVFGNTVTENWVDTGAALFPYQRQNSFNIDYGCINPSSIAYQGNFIVWIGVSEEAGPVVMYTEGNNLVEVSTDGIDYVLGLLKNPEDCSGFLVKVDGHLFYQFTFKSDNITYLYDFTTKLFFTVTDENLNYHIARKIVYFNNTYYFVSFNDGNLYEFGTQFSSYQYQNTDAEIPRIRITSPKRLTSQRPMIYKSLSFTIEQGEYNPTNNMAVDLSLSRDGGVNFGQALRQYMNPTGVRRSRFIYQRLGRANDMSVQLRFIGFGRFCVLNGEIECFL